MEETTGQLESNNQPSEVPASLAPPPQITEEQFRQARRLYFTVRHDIVEACGHQFDRYNNPRTNCENCWWAFFSSHGELVQTADKAFQEQGANFLDKMRGVKFRKMFLRYMSTLARLEKENNERQRTEVKTVGLAGEETGQGLRDDRHVSAAGEASRPEDSVNTN